MIAEYLERALEFERMAEESEEAAFKAALLKQAASYRNMATARAANSILPRHRHHNQNRTAAPLEPSDIRRPIRPVLPLKSPGLAAGAFSLRPPQVGGLVRTHIGRRVSHGAIQKTYSVTRL